MEIAKPDDLRADSPLTDPKDDLLGYAPFAKDLAKSIAEMIPSDGFVMAIFGEWGSGKTTALNFVESYLLEMDDTKRPLIVHFNPWWYSGPEQLLIAFFDSLKTQLGRGRAPEDYLGLLDDLATALEHTPVDAVRSAGVWARFLLRLSGRKSPDARAAKEKLVERLRKDKKRIVIIIDDVDRLYAEELREVFRLIRSVADLPYVLYLLAMDRNAVVGSLVEAGFKDGEQYLEKIVQLGRDLPPPFEHQHRELFYGGLRSILGNDWDNLQNDDRWEGQQWSSWATMSAFINTPRRVHRLLNDLRVTYPLVRGQVNLVDFVLWRFLRLFAPVDSQAAIDEPAMFVSDPQAELLQSVRAELRETSDPKKEFHDARQRTVTATHSQKLAIDEILVYLFPRLWGIVGPPKSDAELVFKQPPHDLGRWVREMRICAGYDNFAVYSRGEAVPWLAMASDINELMALDHVEIGRKLLEFADVAEPGAESKARRILFYLPLFVEAMSESQAKNMVLALLHKGDDLLLKVGEYATYGGMMKDSLWNTQALIFSLVQRLRSQDDRGNLLRKGATEGKALSIIVAVIRSIEAASAQRESAKQGVFLLEQQYVDELVQLARKRLRDAASSGDLIDCPNLKWVVTIWHHWEPQQAADWVLSIAQQPAHLARILESLAFWPTEKTIGHRSDWFGLDNLSPIVEPSKIIEQVRALDKRMSLSETQAKAREAFIREFEARESDHD